MSLSSIELREARILSVRLGYGLCELDDVEQWATPLIERMDEPPYALLQLGLARVNGADICFEAFGSLDIGKAGPGEFLLAMSSAEPSKMTLQQLHNLLWSIWERWLSYLTQEGVTRDPALPILERAINAHDVFRENQNGTANPEAARNAATGYFRLVREAAARVTVPS